MDDDKYFSFLKDLAKHIIPTSATVLPVLQAQGRFLAEDVVYNEQKDETHFAETDGYAVAWSIVATASPETPVILSIADQETEIVNHALFAYKIKKNETLPFKTDTVVTSDLLSNYNESDPNRELIEITFKPTKRLANTRSQNSDNSLKIKKSQKSTPEVISLLLAHGVKEVKIFERPVVGLLWGSSAVTTGEIDELAVKKESGLDKRYPVYWLGMLLQQNGIPVIDLGNIACNHEKIDELLDKFSWQVDCLIWCGDPIEDPKIKNRQISLSLVEATNVFDVNSYMYDSTLTFEIPSKIISINKFYNLVLMPILFYMSGGVLKANYIEPATPGFFNMSSFDEFCYLNSNYQPVTQQLSEMDLLNPTNKVEYILSIWNPKRTELIPEINIEEPRLMMSNIDESTDNLGCILPLGNITSKTKTFELLEALDLQEESNSTYIFDLISKKNEDQAAAALVAEEHSQASVQSAEELSASLNLGMEANTSQETRQSGFDRKQQNQGFRPKPIRPIQGKPNRFDRSNQPTEESIGGKPTMIKPDRFPPKHSNNPQISHTRQQIDRSDRPSPQHSVTFVHGNFPKKRFIPRIKPEKGEFENPDNDD